MNSLLLASVTLLHVFVLCSARSDGAPRSACSFMKPEHGMDVQRGNAPYSVKAQKNGQKVRITISSPIGEEFQGFMVQARSSHNPDIFIDGEFTRSEDAKTVDCFNRKKNTLTHIDASPKIEITTEWTPRSSVNEDVIFRATVLKTYAVFWTNIDSRPVRIRGEDMKSAQTEKMGSEGNSHPMYDGCFTSKGCFGLPSGCAQIHDCEVLLTYEKGEGGVVFTLRGFLDKNDMYMAMALSFDDKMGEDAVTECIRSDDRVMARESWNGPKPQNQFIRELPRSGYDGSFSNGLTSCSWTADYRLKFNDRIYDLANNSYHVLLATGEVQNGNIRYHKSRLASGSAVNFTAFEAVGSEKIADSVKIHGTFMVTAWVGFVSLAILLARHFKNTWENSTLGGVKIWFALHRGFMLAALAFFVIAFIVIFVHKNGWNYQTKNPHAILGCIAVALGILNPIMALFRPGADHKKRPIFNWLHFAVGNLAHLFAIITIFFAVSLPSSGLKDNFYWVMGIFVVVHLVFHLLFQTHSWTQSKKKNNDIGMNDMNGARSSAHNGQSAQAKNINDNVFRILLLGIYSIFIFAILISLYALIGVA